MPVIQVTAPGTADGEADAARLQALCGAVASALGLPPTGVVAVLCEAAVTTTGAGPVPAWPLAVLHGSDRGADATRRALEAAAGSLAEGWAVPRDEVWAEWAATGPAVRP
ncbi:hypothetical protein AB0J21_04130 [Streptomyces sp. NPDC049954]|uniref:hypothetical protein n=1 Tax=Streptomyces sp. NPDC049954 TaxID=3155779 RepID=UPI00341A6B41